MKTLDLVQGSPEWHAHRATHFNASDAPAMMACSKHKTRSQLMHELHTGITPEVDAAQQRRFDDGHRAEALARPLAEAIIGEDLYPVVGTEGELSASFDGLTMDESIAFEHKSLNDELRAAMTTTDGAALPLAYRVQMEQQCAVSRCEKVLFMATKWERNHDFTEDHPEAYTLVERREAWYLPDLKLRAQIFAGWAQFAQDLAAYVPSTAPLVEKVVAEPVEALPAPFVQVTGQLALQDNFKVFEERLRDFLANRLIREPKTDQDFADLDVQIKAMKQGREALKSAKAQMLAQVQPVDMANKAAEALDKLLQQNCKMAEDLMTAEKERRRGEIVADGVKGLAAHVTALNERLGKPYMPTVPADFGGAIKGRRSLSSMEEAVSNELTRSKLAANEIADRIQVNLTTLREQATEVAFLFPDTAQIVLKAPDDLSTLVKARIGEHQAKEAARIEADRKRIREEEAARVERAQREAQEAEDALISSLWSNARRIERDSVPYIQKAIGMFETGAKDWENDPRPRVAAAVVSARAEMKAKLEAATLREQATAAAAPAPAAAPETIAAAPVPAPAPAPAPTVIAMPQRAAAAPASAPTLSIGAINERLQHFTVTEAGLRGLGFEPAGRERAAPRYHESDFPHVLASIVAHVQSIQAKQAA